MFGWFKRLLCRLGIPLHEFCDRCGSQVGVIWRAPDGLWKQIAGKPDGVLCVKCFDDLCARHGLLIRWVPIIMELDE